MSPKTRIAAALALVLATPAAVDAQEPAKAPARAMIRLVDRSVCNADYTVRADRARPRIADPEPETAPPPAEPAPAPEPTGDPYGFLSILNNYRASAGLPPIAYDANLSGWAASNNAAQNARGLGHHVNPGCRQNSGWNYADAWSCAVGWMNSPAHRDTMLHPGASRFGIAYGPGPYWTLNVQ